MRPSVASLSLAPLLLSLIPFSLAQNIPTYFIITSPSKGTVWSNNATNLISWVHAADQVPTGLFDIELARLSTDGLLFVARNAEMTWDGVNIDVIDVPLGDDYFLLFLDVQNGMSYSTSQRFSIQSSNGTTPFTDSTKPTASISGAPNPTAQFYTTFGPSANSAPSSSLQPLRMSGGWMGAGLAMLGLGLGAWVAL